MATATESRLQAWGILRPAVTVQAARDAGLELAVACVSLFKESGGGRMIWGSDGRYRTPPARRTDASGSVIYEFGGPVTPDNYVRYRAAQRAGLIPRQGVGDCQLTSEEYIARAELLGGPAGPADPYCNQRAGFHGLASLQRQYGAQQGFRRYNGSGANAEAYAVKAMGQLAVWRDRLGSLNFPGGPARPLTRVATVQEVDLLPDEREALLEIRDLLGRTKPGERLPARSENSRAVRTGDRHEDQFGFVMNAEADAADAAAASARIESKLDALLASGRPGGPDTEIAARLDRLETLLGSLTSGALADLGTYQLTRVDGGDSSG